MKGLGISKLEILNVLKYGNIECKCGKYSSIQKIPWNYREEKKNEIISLMESIDVRRKANFP